MIKLQKLFKLNNLSTNIIKNFVDNIGYDGNSYIKMVGYPPIYIVDYMFNYLPGQYVYPGDKKEIEKIIKFGNLDKKQINNIKKQGFIKILKQHLLNDKDKNIIETIIHERIHYNRNVLLYDVDLSNGYLIDNNNYVQISDKYKYQYGDLNHDVLKGKFDTSKKTIQIYSKKSKKEIVHLQIDSMENNDKLTFYQNVDETLVEMMAILSVKLYYNSNMSLMDHIKDLIIKTEKIYNKKSFEEKEELLRIINIGRIIIKHNDFELFKWMLNPIEYCFGDIHYDFFKEYTKNDPQYYLDCFRIDINDDYTRKIQ